MNSASRSLLVTGGTGFIGARLAKRSLEAGDHVRVLARLNNPVERERARWLRDIGVEVTEGSVTSERDVEQAMKGVDVVLHLAAAQHEGNVADDYFRSINVQGTINVLKAANAVGVERFVHCSSIGVYGWRPGEVVSDNSRLQPDNIYGVTKLEAEHAVSTSSVPWVIVRISETYGPGDRRLLKLFKSAERGFLIQIGSGDNLHHLINVDDLTAGLRAAITRDAAVSSTFVLAGAQSVSTRELLNAIGTAAGGSVTTVRLPLAPLMSMASLVESVCKPLGIQPPLHRRRMDFFRKSFCFECAAAWDVLGCHPEVGLAEGIAGTRAWYEEQGLLSDTIRSSGASSDSEGQAAKVPIAEPIDPQVAANMKLSARTEPFDSFWEAPRDIEKGYRTVYAFYRHNYLARLPSDRDAQILAVSCGPGYFVDMLGRHGFVNVAGIDSDASKVEQGRQRGLDCRVARAFAWLSGYSDHYDVIFCEQELNHLTKDEMVVFLQLCHRALKPGGRLVVHALNGANPVTGSEALAQNFDHFNSFTEYSLKQVLEHTDFADIAVFPLNLYVFFRNPFNYVAWGVSATLELLFRALFVLYGKENRIFTKKVAAICRKPCPVA